MVPVHEWGPDAPTTPRLALSLRNLGREVDARWPGRDRASDGWIGDLSHQQRDSDHNPDPRGIVHAADIDASDVDPWALVVAAVVHPSTSYVIFRGRIFSRSHLWSARDYTGPDPHTSHVHVSILHTHKAEQSPRHWIERP